VLANPAAERQRYAELEQEAALRTLEGIAGEAPALRDARKTI